jgi:hypothetical protein
MKPTISGITRFAESFDQGYPFEFGAGHSHLLLD